jgi:hypothetical protein
MNHTSAHFTESLTLSLELGSSWLLLLVCLLFAVNSNASDAVTAQANQLLQQRCMVCHGCYDAPCQLKLEAQIGLQRGASKDLVYDSRRLRAGNLTRLFDDAFTEQQWRDKGFYPVLAKTGPNSVLCIACWS